MDFTMSPKQKEWLERVQSFMTRHVRPAVPVYKQQDAEGGRWKVIPILEELKAKARAEGLWNMFLPPSSHEDDEFRGAGLTNLEYALLSEEMGHISWASEVFNCSAPDTGNMEVLMRYGNKEHKRQWLRPLMDGEIRSAFLMTEPAVASSDATNIETRIERDGDHYVINGRKWWSSGVGDPRCKIAILMGKTDPTAAKHQQQSQILVQLDTPGIKVEKMLPVFGFDDAPHGHAQVLLENVRVPVGNLLLGGVHGEVPVRGGRLGEARVLAQLDRARHLAVTAAGQAVAVVGTVLEDKDRPRAVRHCAPGYEARRKIRALPCELPFRCPGPNDSSTTTSRPRAAAAQAAAEPARPAPTMMRSAVVVIAGCLPSGGGGD